MENEDLNYLADTFLICYLNGFEEARDQMDLAKNLVKNKYPKTYTSLKEALRILRKVKYN
jgi:hypothetical protein